MLCVAPLVFPQVQKMRWRVEPEEARPPDKPRLCCCITEKVYMCSELAQVPFAPELRPALCHDLLVRNMFYFVVHGAADVEAKTAVIGAMLAILYLELRGEIRGFCVLYKVQLQTDSHHGTGHILSLIRSCCFSAYASVEIQRLGAWHHQRGWIACHLLALARTTSWAENKDQTACCGGIYQFFAVSCVHTKLMQRTSPNNLLVRCFVSAPRNPRPQTTPPRQAIDCVFMAFFTCCAKWRRRCPRWLCCCCNSCCPGRTSASGGRYSRVTTTGEDGDEGPDDYDSELDDDDDDVDFGAREEEADLCRPGPGRAGRAKAGPPRPPRRARQNGR